MCRLMNACYLNPNRIQQLQGFASLTSAFEETELCLAGVEEINCEEGRRGEAVDWFSETVSSRSVLPSTWRSSSALFASLNRLHTRTEASSVHLHPLVSVLYTLFTISHELFPLEQGQI